MNIFSFGQLAAKMVRNDHAMFISPTIIMGFNMVRKLELDVSVIVNPPGPDLGAEYQPSALRGKSAPVSETPIVSRTKTASLDRLGTIGGIANAGFRVRLYRDVFLGVSMSTNAVLVGTTVTGLLGPGGPITIPGDTTVSHI